LRAQLTIDDAIRTADHEAPSGNAARIDRFRELHFDRFVSLDVDLTVGRPSHHDSQGSLRFTRGACSGIGRLRLSGNRAIVADGTKILPARAIATARSVVANLAARPTCRVRRVAVFEWRTFGAQLAPSTTTTANPTRPQPLRTIEAMVSVGRRRGQQRVRRPQRNFSPHTHCRSDRLQARSGGKS